MGLDSASHGTQDVLMSQKQTLSDMTAAAVRAEMAFRRLSTSELAQVLQVGQRAAVRRLNGEIEFGLNEIERVSQWLGVKHTDLLNRQERSDQRMDAAS